MKWIVNRPDGYASSLKEFAGKNLTIVNLSAIDVFYDVQLGGSQINSTLPGVTPLGVKLFAGGGREQWTSAPMEIWVRAISQTTLDVQSDTGNVESHPSVQPGNAVGALVNMGHPIIGRLFKGHQETYFKPKKKWWQR
jgi:hypothetical protein